MKKIIKARVARKKAMMNRSKADAKVTIGKDAQTTKTPTTRNTDTKTQTDTGSKTQKTKVPGVPGTSKKPDNDNDLMTFYPKKYADPLNLDKVKGAMDRSRSLGVSGRKTA